MYKKYLITGASGFLGSAVINLLVSSSAKVYALTLPNDSLSDNLPEEVIRIKGDVCDFSSLSEFFHTADESTCVIHCAGIVSVASRPSDKLYQVNVNGTKNILSSLENRNVAKFIYVSSVHAIPQQPKGIPIKEVSEFSPERVVGEYAKTKAAATQAVLDAAKRGLNASIVFPSGIIGPNDAAKGSITSMLSAYLSGKLPIAVKGGYDFVDVRDVAAGIVSCTEKGVKGEGYILSGSYATIKEMIDCAKNVTGMKKRVTYFPIGVAKAVAPLYERIASRKKEKLYFTPYSVKVLSSNGLFSNEKARSELNFRPRPIEETLSDAIRWIKEKIIENKTK